MTRPLDTVESVIHEADARIGGIGREHSRNVARAVLDALTTDPDVRERVEAAIHKRLDAIAVCSHGYESYAADCEVLADVALAALRDEETRCAHKSKARVGRDGEWACNDCGEHGWWER